MLRKCLSFMLALVIASGMFAFTATAAESLSIMIDGIPVANAEPFIDANNRTMVPVRFISEALNAKVEWDSDEQMAVVTKGSIYIYIVIGSDTISVNGRPVTMDTVAIIRDGRTFVPVRFIAEALELTVGWNAAQKTVTLTTGGMAGTIITANEAKAALQAWLGQHPFQLGASIDAGFDSHVEGGREYYRFRVGIVRLGTAEILVDKQTGEMYHLTSPYATVRFAPIDDWYNSDHADNTASLLSAEAARDGLQAWLDAHPLTPPATISAEYDNHSWDGAEYFLFSLTSTVDYYPLFLVNRETGVLSLVFGPDDLGPIGNWPPDAWYSEHFGNNSDSDALTEKEARNIYGKWLSSHPDAAMYTISKEPGEEYAWDGKIYYLFRAEDVGHYWYNVLVHVVTGELYILMSPDGPEPILTVEPIEDWYNGY